MRSHDFFRRHDEEESLSNIKEEVLEAEFEFVRKFVLFISKNEFYLIRNINVKMHRKPNIENVTSSNIARISVAFY